MVSDGNGGQLDSAKATQRDLLVALHVKVDELRETSKDHETRLRYTESWISRLPSMAALATLISIAAVLLDVTTR
jgi:hypothetical protein